ncbi:MAG TPA: VOC family protein, partial [Terriglobales bacterium]|nr:VOC family protein [Terriglobales bacterium]
MAKVSRAEQLDSIVQEILESPRARVPQTDAELSALARIAAELRNLPRPEFKTRLKNNLKRSKSMATVAEPISKLQTIASPILTFKNAAKAIEFYTKAFGAKETMRFELGGSIPHAEIMIGNSTIVLTEEWPEGGRFSVETLGQSPISISIQVEDVDSFS